MCAWLINARAPVAKARGTRITNVASAQTFIHRENMQYYVMRTQLKMADHSSCIQKFQNFPGKLAPGSLTLQPQGLFVAYYVPSYASYDPCMVLVATGAEIVSFTGPTPHYKRRKAPRNEGKVRRSGGLLPCKILKF